MGTHRKLRFWTHSGVKVYDNTAAPTSWTDLDLSSVVGKNRALVFLKTKDSDVGGGEVYYFRINGETEDVAWSYQDASANNIMLVNSQHIAHVVMETDANGLIEWWTVNGHKTDLWVLGYVR